MRELQVKRRLDALDARLLTLMQREVPLVARPYHTLARRLGIGGEEVMRRVKRLQQAGILRQIGAIFDANALGYRSALVAVKCLRGRRDDIAAAVSRHPGVSHNYARNHRLDLWFTIAVAPGCDIAAEVARLLRPTGATDYVILPALKVFKTGVMLSVGGENDADAAAVAASEAGRKRAGAGGPTRSQIAAVRALQGRLPVVERPFLALARPIGISERALLGRARRLLSTGAMRRFAAVLHHRRVGYMANAMAVWKVDQGSMARAGKLAASFSAVSHCYQRATAPGWPYNLFAMIHGRTRAECLGVADAISRKIGNPPRAVLFSTREYKKARPLYFPPQPRPSLLGRWPSSLGCRAASALLGANRQETREGKQVRVGDSQNT